MSLNVFVCAVFLTRGGVGAGAAPCAVLQYTTSEQPVSFLKLVSAGQGYQCPNRRG